MKKNRNSGFTLIEMVAVVAIIAVLSVSMSFGVNKIMKTTKTKECKGYMNQIEQAISVCKKLTSSDCNKGDNITISSLETSGLLDEDTVTKVESLLEKKLGYDVKLNVDKEFNLYVNDAAYKESFCEF